MLFDKENLVKKKDELRQWFDVAIPILKDPEFKDTLKARIKKEDITEKQFKKIEKQFTEEKAEKFDK